MADVSSFLEEHFVDDAMFSLVATLAKCLLPRRAGVCLQSANHQNQSSLRCRLQKPLCSSMRHFVFEVGVHPHQASAHRKNSMTHLQLQVCNRAHSTVNTIGDLRSGISSNTNSTFRVTRAPRIPHAMFLRPPFSAPFC